MAEEPRDANGYLYSEYPAVRARGRQKVKNEAWPQRKDGIGQAVGKEFEDKPHDQQVDVQVRAVFEDDGETWLDGRAIRWNRAYVCVYVTDARLSSPYLWVRAKDIRRRRA